MASVFLYAGRLLRLPGRLISTVWLAWTDRYDRLPGAKATHHLAKTAIELSKEFGECEGSAQFQNLVVTKVRQSDGSLKLEIREIVPRENRNRSREPASLGEPGNLRALRSATYAAGAIEQHADTLHATAGRHRPTSPQS